MIFIFVVIVAGLVWFFIWYRRETRNSEWQTFAPATYKYRRFRNGKWEYKDMTPEEAERHQLDNAW
ncbi:hypothetical protein AC629_42575 [Bradyrhizobium sp. NAS80.1]|nr:hypothetical protein AC629_42575 [Bradyrhizobium sp. NAS80.1]